METNQGYKNKALASLEGKWSTAAIVSLIFFAITEGVSMVVTAPMGTDKIMAYSTQGIWELLCLPLGWGFTVYFLNLIRNEDISYTRLFDGFKDFLRIFLTEFLVVLAVLIGCIFLIVPGIILALMFAQVEFILKDDKEIGAVDAMMKSMKMMEGHKVELFLLILSFFGWFLLACITFGLGFLLLAPYFSATMAHYYEDLKAETADEIF
ncbi:MAG: DUF975 family protein [Prevotella sp.]|nr:DUF975 family protein [Prevotella sp.]